ncbi:hypothetical protein [Paracoccus sulfuroxidans]|uniref:Uncharacterized protein n=1 Tax=Paracoccus sulfuroxidans TaxID=384678 RepID=A0A562N7T6_9RHOB|nr:hypothetical protein [Paracoccus sulfuroxidans]TWI28197.1 hypothetical protein IQ24_03814 [Paracoccus sulfuroxidans]
MAEEHPNMFARVLDSIQRMIRPDYSQNREVQRAAALAIATDQRELIGFARKEAVDYLSKLAEIPAPDRAAHLKLERIDPGETSEWRAEDWADKAKLVAKVEADVLAWAKDNKLDLETHDDRFAAYVGVGSAYGAAHLAINFAEWEKEYWESHPEMTEIGEWEVEDGANEYRLSVAVIDGKFHPAVETSYMGGEEVYSYSAVAFDTAREARAVAQSYYAHMQFGDGDEAFRREIVELGQSREGQVATQQQEAVTAGREAEARGESVIYVHGRPFADPGRDVNVSTEPAPNRDPQAVIAEARAARITTAFDEMADAVIAGERPQFRREEQAAAFRRDVEAHYGQGAMERLRSGDSTDLSRDVSDPARVAIIGAAIRMMAETHEALRDAAPEQTLSQATVIDRDSGLDLDL